MATKLELLKEIYSVQNQINALTGKPEVNINTLHSWHLREEAEAEKKYRLQERLDRLRHSLEKTKSNQATKEKSDAYYATEEGAKFKADTEAAINAIVNQWDIFERTTVDSIEKELKLKLGGSWTLARLSKGYLEIGVVDAGKSTSKRKEFFFGQTINIRYEKSSWRNKEEVFECNCGGCGSFSMEGGSTIGERAMFYAGIGKLYADAQLVAYLKDTMRTTEILINEIQDQLEVLRNLLADPFQKSDQ